jgi:hypothetical protein
MTSTEDSTTQRIFKTCLPSFAGGITLTSGTAYFVYVGRAITSITPKYVEFYVSTVGAGTQTAEVGLFSTTNPPYKSAQTFTKIVATGTVDSLTSTGVKRNTSAFTQSVSSGTHIWAGIRTAMATTQPTIYGCYMDNSQGHIQSTASSGVLTGTGPWSGSLIAAGTTVQCPELRVTLD